MSNCNVTEGSYCCCKPELHSHVHKIPLCDYFKPLGSLHTRTPYFSQHPLWCVVQIHLTDSCGFDLLDILRLIFCIHIYPTCYTWLVHCILFSTNNATIIIKDEIDPSPNYVLFPIPLLLHVF